MHKFVRIARLLLNENHETAIMTLNLTCNLTLLMEIHNGNHVINLAGDEEMKKEKKKKKQSFT
jgi:hypothetical protein